MAETISSLQDLKSATAEPAPLAPVHVQKLDKYGRAYATGKRKNAIARVWIKPGAVKVTVNGRELEVYFARPVLRMILQQPLGIANRADQYDITVTVAGGGLSGQAGALRHGISRALLEADPNLRGELKRRGFLTRDARAKERTAKFILEGRFPERIVEKAVQRMLPHGPLGVKQLSNLRVYKGAEHPHVAQNPSVLDVAALNSKNVRND